MQHPFPDRAAVPPGAARRVPSVRLGEESNRLALVVLVLAALAARARVFGNPIVFSDEEWYLYVARRMLDGALPYVDLWDRKPIGLFLFYLPAAPFSPQGSVYAYQLMFFAVAVATAWLLFDTARAVGWRRGALVSGVLYLFWLDLADGQGGQSPVLYNLPMIAAVRLAVAPAEPSRRAGLGAMALVGIALQIKYSVVFEGMAIGLWLMAAEWRRTRSAWRTAGWGAALAAVALLPTALAFGCYAAIGEGATFVFANFVSILLRHPDPAWMQIDNAETAVELLGPLVLFALAGIGAAPAGAAWQMRARAGLLGWFAVALAGFAAFGGWYNHYTLPVMLPGCLCAAGFFSDRRIGRWLALPAVAAVFAAGQLVLSSELHHRGTPAQFYALASLVGPGPGSLYGDMGHPALHMFTGRPALSRWMFPSHLQIAREAGALGVDQAKEIDRIFAKRPDVVTIEGPWNGAAPARVAQVERLVRRGGYGAPVRLPLGGMWVDVYRLEPRPALTSRP